MLKTRKLLTNESSIDVSLSSPRQPQSTRNKTSPTKGELFGYDLSLLVSTE